MSLAREQHFLVVTFYGQGHINPGRRLALRIAKATGARVTFSTTLSSHRLMFPQLSNPDQEITDGPITYIPYSDGYDHGMNWFVDDAADYGEKFNRVGPATLSSVIDRLAARGTPVTCIIYSMLMHWVKEIALARDIPTAFYWVQPGIMLGIYYHYFHGYSELITDHVHEPSFVVNMPHLPSLKIRDLPDFFVKFMEGSSKLILEIAKQTLESVLKPGKDGRKSMLLVNTFEELEAEALKCIEEAEVLPIGPEMPLLVQEGNEVINKSGDCDVFKEDGKDYMAWLDSKPRKSVVFVSFGSIMAMSKKQLEEMQRGLKESGRPYLLVVRKNNREEAVKLEEGENGMVVEWCNQVQVLSHASVGCFVTHCGWNSTLESLACGVPMVAVPQWSDQDTNARMLVEWSVGVRGEVNEEGILEGEALVKCLETVMGDGEKGVGIRNSCKLWREKEREAVGEGGSSDCNFKYFLEKLSSSTC